MPSSIGTRRTPRRLDAIGRENERDSALRGIRRPLENACGSRRRGAKDNEGVEEATAAKRREYWGLDLATLRKSRGESAACRRRRPPRRWARCGPSRRNPLLRPSTLQSADSPFRAGRDAAYRFRL